MSIKYRNFIKRLREFYRKYYNYIYLDLSREMNFKTSFNRKAFHW